MAGAGAGPQEFTEEQKNVIRYVVAMHSEFLDRTKLPWKPVEKDLVVYRGQSGSTKGKGSIATEAERTGWKQILSTFRDKSSQISTSKKLGAKILTFARGYELDDPTGRVFQITVKPGVRHVDIDAVRSGIGKLTNGSQDAKFQFIIDEAKPHWEREKDKLIADKLVLIRGRKWYKNAVDKINKNKTGAEAAAELDKLNTNAAKTAEQHAINAHYSFKTPEDIRNVFVRNTLGEREILLDLAGTEFVRPDGTPETWTDDASILQLQYVVKETKNLETEEYEVVMSGKEYTVPVYPTVLRPKASGGRRGRTFRRTFRRRDKNGGRPTRKSKPRRHK